MAGRGDLTDSGLALEPLLPVSNGCCGRWRDHRQVINGVLHRVRTGVQWPDLPERFGPWKTVHTMEDRAQEAPAMVGRRHLGASLAAGPGRRRRRVIHRLGCLG
ncbi:transposase [Kitasatospora purpeofusca]|uniref:transposase n=1 Tax=Kitasatospora purpeofusca TaxID=67352 RepID=UPI0035E04071